MSYDLPKHDFFVCFVLLAFNHVKTSTGIRCMNFNVLQLCLGTFIIFNMECKSGCLFVISEAKQNNAKLR